jgi:hypothetical protein
VEKCPAAPGKGAQQGQRVVRTTAEELLSEQRRRYQTTPEFEARYANRAGIEGSNSELKRRHGLGHLPVRGEQRVRLAVYLKVAACNVKRAVVYLGKRLRAAAAHEPLTAQQLWVGRRDVNALR